MSSGQNETKMSPKIQAATEAHRKAIAEQEQAYRQMIDTREAIERGEWWLDPNIGRD